MLDRASHDHIVQWLYEGLRDLATNRHDPNYTPQDYAAAVLDGLGDFDPIREKMWQSFKLWDAFERRQPSDFDESQHPRGQPGNAGQFTHGGATEDTAPRQPKEPKPGKPAAAAAPPPVPKPTSPPSAAAVGAVHPAMQAVADSMGWPMDRTDFVGGSAGAFASSSTASGRITVAPDTMAAQGELFPGMFPPIGEGGGAKKPTDFSDFSKGGIRLVGATGMSPGSEGAKFLERWNERIDMSPEEFAQKFTGGVGKVTEIQWRPYDDAIEVEGKIISPDDGASIGSFTRTIDFDDNTAHSDYLSMRRTGHDVGKTFLGANVEMYQQLGIDNVQVHANIDVGGYAWAKYGYVPNDSDILDSVLENLGGRKAYEWDEMSSDQQDRVRDQWKENTQSEFEDMVREDYQDSGQALNDAKTDLANEYTPDKQWAENAFDKVAAAHGGADKMPYGREELLAAVNVSYDDSRGDGRADPDFEFDKDKVLKPEDMTDELWSEMESALTDSFNGRAEDKAVDMEPPDISDQVSDRQNDYWDTMSSRDMFRYAEEYDMTGTGAESTLSGADESDLQYLRELAESGDPKAIWAIADSQWGKDLLLGTDWNGTLDLNDKDSMDRFNAYIAKGKAKAAAQAAAA